MSDRRRGTRPFTGDDALIVAAQSLVVLYLVWTAFAGTLHLRAADYDLPAWLRWALALASVAYVAFELVAFRRRRPPRRP